MPPPRPVSRRRAPRWRRRKDARPDEILEAALDVFATRGYAAARLDEVARRAGVTKGTIYLYYRGKAALFKAVVRRSLIPNIERAEAANAAHTGSAADALRQFIRTLWHTVGETRLGAIPKLIIAEAANFPEVARFYWTEVASRGLALLSSIIERGMARGEFRRVDARFATLSAVGPVFFLVIFKHSIYPVSGLKLDFQRLINAHLENFLRGLAHA